MVAVTWSTVSLLLGCLPKGVWIRGELAGNGAPRIVSETAFGDDSSWRTMHLFPK